jgi:hypothetical protein
VYAKEVAIAPDASSVLFESGGRIHVVDPSTGEQKGTLQEVDVCPNFSMADGAFSPDGLKFAALSKHGSENLSFVACWDLATGERLSQFPVAADAENLLWSHSGDLVMLGKEKLKKPSDLVQEKRLGMIGNPRALLVDAETGALLWEYEMTSASDSFFPHSRHGSVFCHLFAPGGRAAPVNRLELPDEEVADVLRSREVSPPEPLLSPGEEFHIVLKLENVPRIYEEHEVEEALLDILSRKLVENGMKISDSEKENELQITLESIDTEEDYHFRVLGGGILPRRVDDMLVRAKIAMVSEGKTLWHTKESMKTSNSGGFGVNRIPPGEEIDEYLEKRPWRGVFRWMEQLEFPGYLYPRDASKAAGTTEVRDSGCVIVRTP